MTLFDQLEEQGPPLKATVAWERGDAAVSMCANCGLTAYSPSAGDWKANHKLGPCPRCEGTSWLRQSLPVASFGAVS